jgi:hypothetical protein
MAFQIQFMNACEKGDIEAAADMMQHGHIYGAIGLESICTGFKLACINSRINMAEWLLTKGVPVWAYFNNKLFIKCCENGNIAVAEWLLQKKINIKDTAIEACEQALKNGHVEIVKWLLCVTDTAGRYEIFCKICDSKQFEILRHNCFANELLIESCKKGYLNGVRQLYYAGVDINVNNEEAFKTACIHGHLNIAKLIYNFGISTGVTYGDIFRKCKFEKVFDWLNRLDIVLLR